MENLNIHKAVEQSVRDAGKDKLPAVAFKRNNTGWTVAMRAEDFFRAMHGKSKDCWPSWLKARDESSNDNTDVIGRWIKS